MLNQNHLLAIIGAGEAAKPIISKAKEMNVRVLAFARQGSVCQNEVDIFVEENNFDVEFMTRVCRMHHVDGVIASSEITTEATAKLAANLSLPGNSVENGFVGRNKFLMRCRVSSVSSVRQPKYELYDSSHNYSFPVIVKAVDSCGKRGICFVNNQEQLNAAVEIAKEYSSDGNALVESYLEGGTEYSIECLSSGKIHQIVQYTEKESSGPPHFVEIAHHQPAALSLNVKKKIDIAVGDILDALGLNCGMAHMELKVINDEVYFIEVGARHGGDHIADTLTINSTDFDYFKAAIQCSLGIYEPVESHNVAYTGIYFHCKQNIGLEKLFEKAKKAAWCMVDALNESKYSDVSTNVEAAEGGYVIYKSDKKITINNC